MTPRPGPTFFAELVLGVRAAKTTFVAHELGIFAALAQLERESGNEGPGVAAASLAARLDLDLDALTTLLRGLVSLELLRCAKGCSDRFELSEFARATLVPGAARYVGHNLQLQQSLWTCWSGLGQAVRSGRPSSDLWALLHEADGAFVSNYIRGMQDIAKLPAAALADQTRAWPLERILDVGAGPGTFSRALLELHPEASAVLLDTAPTLEVSASLLGDLGARVELRVGDYREGDYGHDFDLVLLSHVTHDERESTMRAMIARAAAACRRGGRVLVHDFVCDEDGCGPAWSAMFSLNLLTYTDGGRVYPISAYRRAMQDAGLDTIEVLEVPAAHGHNPTCSIIGRRSD